MGEVSLGPQILVEAITLVQQLYAKLAWRYTRGFFVGMWDETSVAR
jgi:hypothetical protein